jgi:hypothetical protein
VDLSDYVGVCRTLLDYGTLFDEGSYDQWFELFTANSEFTVRGRTFVGRDGLRAFVAGIDPSSSPARHFMGPPIVTSGGPMECTSHVKFLRMVRNPDGGIVVAGTGSYDDRLIKEDGAWRISVRRHADAAKF